MRTFRLRASAREHPRHDIEFPALALREADREYIRSRRVSDVFMDVEEWHRSGGRIGIPVRDEHGQVVNVRRHLPHAPEDRPKTVHTKGYGSARLLGAHNLREDDNSWVIVCGGEFDYAAAASAGLVAVCGSSGEKAVPVGDLDVLHGRRVALALDADEPGRAAAKGWARALVGIAREVRVVALPEGSDVNDWFVAGKSAEALLRLVDSSSSFTGANRRETADLLAKALAKVDDGQGRDDTGLWLACQLRDEGYSRAESAKVMDTYQQAVEHDKTPPYAARDAEVNLDSAWSRPARQPAPKGGRAVGPPSLEDGPLAEFLGERLRGRFAYVTERKDWLYNDGPLWRPCSHTAVVRHVQVELKGIFDAEVAGGTNLNQATRLLRRAGIENVAALLKGVLEEPYGRWDDHPHHLNTPSGVVDLRTGAVAPHSDAFRFTAITRVGYAPAATSSRWTKALGALPDELHEHVQILFGQAVTGFPPDTDKVTFLQGGGENGKSLILDSIKLALGSFAGPVPERVMLAKPGESVPEMMELRGKRLVVLEEMPQGGRLSTKRLKDVAGTATVDGRPLYGKTVVWTATHTMFVTSNHRPVVTETDHGTWRRLQMLVFPYRFVRTAKLRPGEKRGDPALRHHLRTVPEEAVLAWLVAGARRWYAYDQRTPDPAPQRILDATADWRTTTDDVLQFVADHLDYDPEGVVLAEDLWATFDSWAKAHNKQGWSLNTYADRFEEHPSFKDRGVRRERTRIALAEVSRPRAIVGPGPHLRQPATGDGEDNDGARAKRRIWRGIRWRENP